MGNLADIPQEILASSLESIQDCEGVLVCRDTLRDWPEQSINRAFGTYQFAPFKKKRGGEDDEGPTFVNDGLTFVHDESGTSLTYSAPTVTLEVGGHISEAIPDLLRALHDLGWRNIDIYSVNADALFFDLSRFMPAHLSDFQLQTCDIPTDLNTDLVAFSQAVAGHGGAESVSAEDEFMRVFRSGEGLQPGNEALLDAESSAAPPAIPTPPAIPGMGVGVNVNYVPDDGYTDPADVFPPIPGLPGREEASAASPLSPAPLVVSAGAPRPAFSLATESPVLGAAPAPSVVPPAVEVPSPALPVPALPAAVAEDDIGEAGEMPAAAGKSADGLVRGIPSQIGKRGAPVSFMEVPNSFPSYHAVAAPPSTIVHLGCAVVALDAPWHRLDDAQINELRRSNTGTARDVRIIELGATSFSVEHMRWSPLFDLDRNQTDFRTAQALGTSLWPGAVDAPLLFSSVLALADGTETEYVKSLFSAGGVDFDGMREVLNQRGGEQSGNSLCNQVFPLLLMQWKNRNILSLDASLHKVMTDLWALHRNDDKENSPPPFVSFSSIAHQCDDDHLYLVRIDSLDLGTSYEMLSTGLMRWVEKLSASMAKRPALNKLTPAQLQAMKALENLPPEAQDELRKFLSQKPQ